MIILIIVDHFIQFAYMMMIQIYYQIHLIHYYYIDYYIDYIDCIDIINCFIDINIIVINNDLIYQI